MDGILCLSIRLKRLTAAGIHLWVPREAIHDSQIVSIVKFKEISSCFVPGSVKEIKGSFGGTYHF